MFKLLAYASLAIATLVAAPAAAKAQDRFALVIGNSNYKSVSPLANPARDVEAVGALLKDAGFKVTSALDLDKASMSKVIRFFTSSIAEKPENTVTLIYFAGHGLQVDGENFLVPVDATIAREADVPLEAMRLDDLMSMLETVRSKTRIVFLDACRDNPFGDIAKSTPRGLAMVNAPAGTLLAYSTSPGHSAADGTGNNSPFALALLKSAREPGLPIETALKNVRLAVRGATSGRQTPWEVSALIEPFSFFPGDGAVKADPGATKESEVWRKELKQMTPRQAFDVAIREDNVVVYEIYLTIFGDDPLATEIRPIFDRRQMMIAWLEAVTMNTPAAFAAFLARFPDSDLTETAKRMEERAQARSSFARSLRPVLGLSANALTNSQPPAVREVRVPVIKEVVKEVKVPVVKEVVREVKVPVVKEVVREVKVPVVKEVVREVRVQVPGPVRIVKVPVPGPVRIVKVPVPGPSKPCNCRGGPGPIHGGINQGGGHRFRGGGINLNDLKRRLEGGRNRRR